jgi:hypothetical protein
VFKQNSAAIHASGGRFGIVRIFSGYRLITPKSPLSARVIGLKINK